VSYAVSIERRHATYDERRHSHHHKETHGFELFRHGVQARQPYAILVGNIPREITPPPQTKPLVCDV